jgi:hypothetical protein
MVTLSALHAGRPLFPPPPRKIPGIHFCYRLSRPQGHNAAERIRSIEKIHFIGTRSRDLPACSIVITHSALKNSLGLLKTRMKCKLVK